MKKIISCFTATALIFSLSIPALAAGGFEKVNTYTPGQFTDVPADLWCADNVQTAYEYGIMGGKVSFKDAVRFEKGEGIEKKQENFAAEIASMVKGNG